MPPAPNLAAFALAALLLIIIPGPSVLFVVGRSLALGRRGGLLSVLGNGLGMLPQVAAVAAGLGVLLAESVVLFTIVKIVGAAYLVFLGIQAIRHRSDGTARESDSRRSSAWKLLREGFVVGLTNPKTIVFLVAVLPQFVDFHAGAIPIQMAVLGLVFILIGFVSDSVWALAAGTARDWFARSPKRMAGLSATGGVMMIGLGGALTVTGAKS
jgi:threonine/homoserine/homoserine lactone efflux protein